MSEVDLAARVDGVAGRPIDRRSMLVGAAGALAVIGVGGPARAVASTAGTLGPKFDPDLARRLQAALRGALRDPTTHAPGAVLHVDSPALGASTAVAGFGEVAPRVRMRRVDRFRAGSIAKPFVAVRVLQLAERGRLSLDAPLTKVLPARVAERFANATDITVRMLLGHRSGIPEWDTPLMDIVIAHHPAKRWKIDEMLDLAAAQPPALAPGSGFYYANTDYNLLGLIIERVTGHTWRREIARHVINPLGLRHTSLPASGSRSIKGPHAHGYGELDGRQVDLTGVDPSMAGAAGGGALVTTVGDLARFLNALLKGRLFRRRATLDEMLAFAPAQGEGGLVGYGLGIEQRALPGGAELIGHLGGTAGYRAYMGRLRPQNVTMTFMLNWQDDPTPLVIPVVQALTST